VDADIVRLTGLVLALTHAAGFDPCRTFAHLAFVPEPYASTDKMRPGRAAVARGSRTIPPD
jgi:hypothetical protein